MITPSDSDKKASETATATKRGLEMMFSILSEDDLEAAERYDLLRRRTLRYFQWKGSADAAELTDAALMRVGRKLGEGAPVGRGELGPFVRGVARMVFLESLRNEKHERKRRDQAISLAPESETELDDRLGELESCLEELDRDGRTLILDYYQDSGEGKVASRRKLAELLGISMTALRIRAHRLRERLQKCVEARAEDRAD